MALYDKNTGKLNVPPGFAVHLRKTGIKWASRDLLSELVPQRVSYMFALDPRKWQGTFYSLTLKDPKKISSYQPQIVQIAPGTVIADMALANVYQRTGDVAAAEQYRDSIQPFEDADIAEYKFPELLIPR